ncbi:MAG: alcohol dehydrogenase catalytic domain-containing protein [Acidobacteriia bacterium]|nr:alcohol dehydrogenase catalytic domain-containing protein [Terriglobia bacterium]
MKAILITAPPHFELTSVPDPRCGPGQVVIRTAYCGICGTDLEILRGGMPKGFARYPVVPGHEWTGVVEEVGSGVTTCRPGDRVSVEGYLPCGQCPRCLAGEFNLCPGHEQIGMTHNGGLAEYVAAPARSCHLVAEHIGLDEALMVEPASTVVRGMERAHPKPRSAAAVIGCGPIGLIAARVLALYDPAAVLGIDLAPTQRAMADRAGFTEFVVGADARELTERSGSDGWDIVVVCAGGARPLEMAIQMVRAGGTIVSIGGSPDSLILHIPANLFVTRDLHIEGILGYTTESWVRTLEWLTSGKLRLGDLITHRTTIHEFDQALALVESRSEPMGKVAVSFV